ncbi:MAG TPA: lysylphosphatidylglycerol synthase domain-containing protein [Pseudomonadales bacterium]|nr:lysylphosphatidylglycerol synthase domain-containing protein [Pseudomonadales bacterium]
MKKLNIILLFAGILFLGGLIFNVGASQLWQELGLLGWGLIPFVLGEGIAEMIHTVGWRYCLAEPYRSISWWRLFQIRMAGYAINYLTPTAALGGEATKVNLLLSYHRGPKAVSGILIEKFCFAFSQVLFALIGCIFIVGRVQLSRPLLISMLLSVGLVSIGIFTFFLLQKYGKLGALVRWLAARWPGNSSLQNLAAQITGVDDAMRNFYAQQPRDFLRAMGWHLAGFSVTILQAWFFLYLLKQGAALPLAATVAFLGMWCDLLTFAVPMNMGSLEGTRIVVFKAIGRGATAGMAYGLAIRLSQIVWSVFGLALYGWLMAKENKPVEIAPAPIATHPPISLEQKPKSFNDVSSPADTTFSGSSSLK